MLRIYDGSNYFRVAIATDFSGLAPRNLFLEMIKPETVAIWVWDGPQNNQFRREIFPDYKMNRTPMAENVFASMNLFKKVLRHTRAIQIEIPGYEADDIVATLAKRYASPSQPVSIYSNDFDYYQLHVNPNIITGAKEKEDVAPDEVRLYKTLVGDPADNIKGIPGFGPKAWKHCNRKALQAWLESGEPLSTYTSGRDVCFGVSKRVAASLQEHEELARTYWKIIAFRDVPLELIEQHMIPGDGNAAAGDALLKEFYL